MSSPVILGQNNVALTTRILIALATKIRAI